MQRKETFGGHFKTVDFFPRTLQQGTGPFNHFGNTPPSLECVPSPGTVDKDL